MYVLNSFSHGVCMTLGKEQAVALYLTAGCVASFASYAHKVFTGLSGASLGAVSSIQLILHYNSTLIFFFKKKNKFFQSGAILGFLGYICTKYPDTQLQIMFLPMFQFSADSAIKVIMAIDICGCIFGWKFFDHAAHLGGAAFGM